jgi:hypothetical protein
VTAPLSKLTDASSGLWSQTDDIVSEAGTMHIAIRLLYDVAMDIGQMPNASGQCDKVHYLAGDLETRLEKIEAIAEKVCDRLKQMRVEGAQ